MKLHDLYNDKELLNDLRQYLNAYVREHGVDKMLAREDVSGVADAAEIITKAFDNLDVQFAPKGDIPKIQISRAR